MLVTAGAGAVRTTEESAADRHAVPDDGALAVLTDRREPMDRALERVEHVQLAVAERAAAAAANAGVSNGTINPTDAARMPNATSESPRVAVANGAADRRNAPPPMRK